MLQRIQTIFLLAVVFLSGLLLHFPLAIYTNLIETCDFTVFGIKATEGTAVASTWPLALLNIVITAVALATIFMYKNRILQIRLSIFNIALMLGFYILTFLYIFKMSDSSAYSFNFKLPVVFHAISVILTYMAIRAIGKDEALVRSVNHLR